MFRWILHSERIPFNSKRFDALFSEITRLRAFGFNACIFNVDGESWVIVTTVAISEAIEEVQAAWRLIQSSN